MNVVWAGIGVLVVVVLWAVLAHNRFVRQRQLIDNSWSNVDTELQRRHELVPNLVATVRGYATHEQSTFEAVTEARAAASAGTTAAGAAEQTRAENVLAGSLRSLLALQEAYPELQADERFADLQRQLVVTEDRIQAARRLFNANVRDFNRRVQSIPTNLIASMGGFESAAYFEADPVVGEPPAVELR